MNLRKIKIAIIVFLAIGIPTLNVTRFLLDRFYKNSHYDTFVEKPFDFLLIDQYKFFSPNIANGYIMLITTLPDETIIPMKVNNSEFINRLHGVYHTVDLQRETAEALMHSMAVYVLSNNPGTRAIDMKLLEYKLPKISEYANDKISYGLIFENTYSY